MLWKINKIHIVLYVYLLINKSGICTPNEKYASSKTDKTKDIGEQCRLNYKGRHGSKFCFNLIGSQKL